jgi:drug/metabolite transporter (DMT)-like permease
VGRCGVCAAGQDVLAEGPGTPEFFSAAIGVLAALLIAFVFSFASVLRGFDRLINLRDPLALAIVLGYLANLALGIGLALVALFHCDGEVCGGSQEADSVTGTLILGGVYLVAAVVAYVIEAMTELRPD